MIGVLDWGLGGLFAVERMLSRVPGLDLVYLSDAGNTPYGLQSRRQLQASVRAGVAHLRSLGASTVLVACHSASTVLPDLQLPSVVGVIRPELVPRGGQLLVLGGARTIRSGVWRRALASHGTVHQRIAQPLSAAVEAGQSTVPTTLALLDRILAPVRAVDTVVLACTHYAALEAAIQQRLPRARLVDPATALVDALPLSPGVGHRHAETTGDPAQLQAVVARLFSDHPMPLRFRRSPRSGALSP